MIAALMVLLTLWLFVRSAWREHIVDSHREELFALRDELFSRAATGGISFSSPGYLAAREHLNRRINVAHLIHDVTVFAILAYVGAVGLPPSGEGCRDPLVGDILDRADRSQVWLFLNNAPVSTVVILATVVGVLVGRGLVHQSRARLRVLLRIGFASKERLLVNELYFHRQEDGRVLA